MFENNDKKICVIDPGSHTMKVDLEGQYVIKKEYLKEE